MEYLNKILNLWQLKLMVSSIIVIFSPFKTALIILSVMIIIDTITGCIYAVKIRRFTSNKFKKGTLKCVTYFSAIVVVRLMEVGISNLFETTLFTRLVTGFLIFTETVSILENLTLLDVPLPAGVLRIVIKNFKFGEFQELFSDAMKKNNYFSEINEIVIYQIPTIKTEEMRKLLKIKYEEWKKSINLIDMQFDKSDSENGELLFYRLLNITNITFKAINEKWTEAGISKECINKFNECHAPRIRNCIESIREICSLDDKAEMKKKAVLNRIMILLYQTIIDAQKK